jgi:type II secretion system protein H
MRRGANNAGKRAFTLVELVVVLVIMGIMAALIIPQMQGTYEDALLRNTSRKIISALNLASSLAVSRNQVFRVRLDSQAGKYGIERRVRGLDRNDGFEPAKDVNGAEGTIDSRITVEVSALIEQPMDEAKAVEEPLLLAGEPSESISFFPDGTAEANEIRLRDRAGFQLVLQVSPVTGRVHIPEPDPAPKQ